MDWGFSGVRQARNWAECKVIHLMLLIFASSSPLHSLVCEEEREEMKEEEGWQRKDGREDGQTDQKTGE